MMARIRSGSISARRDAARIASATSSLSWSPNRCMRFATCARRKVAPGTACAVALAPARSTGLRLRPFRGDGPGPWTAVVGVPCAPGSAAPDRPNRADGASRRNSTRAATRTRTKTSCRPVLHGCYPPPRSLALSAYTVMVPPTCDTLFARRDRLDLRRGSRSAEIRGIVRHPRGREKRPPSSGSTSPTTRKGLRGHASPLDGLAPQMLLLPSRSTSCGRSIGVSVPVGGCPLSITPTPMDGG